MNRLDSKRRAQVIAALVEGNSIRATVRMTGVAKNTIVKLLADLGAVCAEFHDKTVRNVKSRRVQCDEIWSFCYSKAKNVPTDKQGEFGYGDVWTWTAIDADSKLAVAWLVANRDVYAAHAFMQDVASRLANRVQMTTDAHRIYLNAIEGAFGMDIDYAMLTKIYSSEATGKYSPPRFVGATSEVITGSPDPKHIATSYVERQNLTMRMSMRRFTRLTNAFSKKVDNLAHAVALHFVYYNFCRVHQTLRVTPAMEAGLADHVWSIDELVTLLER